MKLVHLLSVFLPLSLILWSLTYIYWWRQMKEVPTPLRWLSSLIIPFSIGVFAYNRKSLSFSGLIVALIVGFILTLSNYCFLTSLLMFFITSSKATKYKSRLKRRLEADFREGGQRNWIQVICNGAVAAEMSLFYIMESGCREVPIDFISQYNVSWSAISVLGAISCANGDTWASELGSVLSTSDPLLITTLKRVPRGTNGGVSLIGLLVSAVGGLVVGFAFFIPIPLFANSDDYKWSPPQFLPLMTVGLFSGVFGSLIDSILGATLQYSGLHMETGKIVEKSGENVEHISGIGLLDNHSVNLLSTLVTAIFSPYFAIRLWTYF